MNKVPLKYVLSYIRSSIPRHSSFSFPDDSPQSGSPLKRIESDDRDAEPYSQTTEQLTHESREVQSDHTGDRFEDGVRSSDLKAKSVRLFL